MANVTRRNFLALSVAAPVGGLWTGGPGGKDGKTPLSPREKIRQRYFPDVTVVTHEGKKVRFYDDLIKDKILYLNVMFAHCADVCPLVTSNLVKVQRSLKDLMGRDIFIVSLTLKPEMDSPKVLREYMKGYGVGPGWTFVTGEPATLELLRVKLGFTYPDPEIDKDATQHIGNVRYGNEPKMLWGACPGMASPSWIITSLSYLVPPPLKDKLLSAAQAPKALAVCQL